MQETIDTTVKQIGEDIIELSALLNAKMEKWSDLPVRPNGLSDTECVGFINKASTQDGVNIIVDIQAPKNQSKALLRIWSIDSAQDHSGNERFNNIQLDFDMDYQSACSLAQKGAATTRDDMRGALRQSSTKLSHVTISNQSGIDKSTQQMLGERYDAAADSIDTEAANKLGQALRKVLATLKKSADV